MHRICAAQVPILAPATAQIAGIAAIRERSGAGIEMKERLNLDRPAFQSSQPAIDNALQPSLLIAPRAAEANLPGFDTAPTATKGALYCTLLTRAHFLSLTNLAHSVSDTPFRYLLAYACCRSAVTVI
jgi:hypothetical protein